MRHQRRSVSPDSFRFFRDRPPRAERPTLRRHPAARLGNLRREPLVNGEAVIDGELECEFEDLGAYADWVAGTQAQLILAFVGPTVIAGGGLFKLTGNISKVAYRGSTPKVDGPDVVMQPRLFEALGRRREPSLRSSSA